MECRWIKNCRVSRLSIYKEKPAIVICTGPSIRKQRERILRLRARDEVRLFGVNNTFNDFPLDVWIACDEDWHAHYGVIEGDFDKWHWDREICIKGGYKYIEGLWEPGLSTDPMCIHYGHSSGYQALGLAYHYGHRDIYMAGFDMSYAHSRHYFSGLSDVAGEYPAPLRKGAPMNKPETKGKPPRELGLFQYYDTVVEQNPCNIYNMTEDSAYKGFEFGQI